MEGIVFLVLNVTFHILKLSLSYRYLSSYHLRYHLKQNEIPEKSFHLGLMLTQWGFLFFGEFEVLRLYTDI